MQPATPEIKDETHIASVDGRWGKCFYFKHDAYIGKSLTHYGEYNPDETETILSLAETCRGKRMLDIGANIGAISQALEASGHRVEAFEPLPQVFDLLRRNIVKGKVHNTALGATAAVTTMPLIDYTQENNFGGFSCRTNGAAGSIKVNLRRLDDYNFDDIGLIKIDVEGFEEEVLRGGIVTIARCKPLLYIEDDRVDKQARLHAMLEALGYEIEPHIADLFRPKNHFGNTKSVWDQEFASMNIICRPKKTA